MADNLQAVFDRIRPFYRRHADAGVVLHDDPGRYYLGTHEVRAKDGYRTWFGGVEVKKAYVSAHVMPIYVIPALAATISPALAKRQQGKSCFNFKAIDEALLAELEALIDAGATAFVERGMLRRL